MTELYCVFYIKSNGFSAQNHAISTLSASNHQISQILWKPSLHIVKNFFKKISAPLQLSQESTDSGNFPQEFPLYTPEMQSFPAGYIASISEVQAHSFSRYHRTVCIQDQQDKITPEYRSHTEESEVRPRPHLRKYQIPARIKSG